MINPINMPADFVASASNASQMNRSQRNWWSRNIAAHLPLRRRKSSQLSSPSPRSPKAADMWNDALRRFNEVRLIDLVKEIDENSRLIADDEFAKISMYSSQLSTVEEGPALDDQIPDVSAEHAIRFHRRTVKRPTNKREAESDAARSSGGPIQPTQPLIVAQAKPTAVDDRPDEPLELNWIDLRIRANGRAHRTDEFECVRSMVKPTLVVRRGQAFELSLSMWRPLNPEHDVIRLVAQMGAQPSAAKGTRVNIECVEGNTVAGWKIESFKVNGWRVKLSLTAAVHAPVGRWTLKIITSLKQDSDAVSTRLHGFFSIDHASDCSECTQTRETPVDDFYLLFNAWCQADPVYMPAESDRDEFVLNDVGKIWRGSHNAPRPTYWAYGQFDESVLEASVQLLELSNLRPATRGDAVHVARTVSEMVNSNDERGVLVGKWDADYAENTIVPTAWTGSSAILRQYASTREPVQYGQCWVFAGVACTIFRALGIPCRVVTNYSSAHDTDTNCTVDVHLSAETGKLSDTLNRDSIWNFHVWNDVWMARADLPGGHDGWQAVDATPQEKSNGIFRAGPASVEAVRRGEVSLAHDAMFVFSEVNADKVYWMTDLKGDATINDIDTAAIGRCVLTKKPGRDLMLGNGDSLDITYQYKHAEGTSLERSAVYNALLVGHHELLTHYSSICKLESASKSVQVELVLGEDKTMVGRELVAHVKAKNASDEERRCKCAIRVNAVSYTGELGPKVKSDLRVFTLQPNGEAIIPVTVSVYEYVHKLSEQSAFLFTVTNVVLETAEVFATTDDIRLIMPDIEIELADQPRVGEECKARCRLDNPLPVGLHNCRFMIEGPGVMNTVTLHCEDVPGGGIALAPFVFTPWKSGRRHLVARFESDQLMDVDGELTLEVQPPLPM